MPTTIRCRRGLSGDRSTQPPSRAARPRAPTASTIAPTSSIRSGSGSGRGGAWRSVPRAPQIAASPSERVARREDQEGDHDRNGRITPRQSHDDHGQDVRRDRDRDDDDDDRGPEGDPARDGGIVGTAPMADRPDDRRATDDRDGDDREPRDGVVRVVREGQHGLDGVDLGRDEDQQEERRAGRGAGPRDEPEVVLRGDLVLDHRGIVLRLHPPASRPRLATSRGDDPACGTESTPSRPCRRARPARTVSLAFCHARVRPGPCVGGPDRRWTLEIPRGC